MYIDSHSHLNSEQFDHDREAIIIQMRNSFVRTQTIGVDLSSSISAIKISQENPDVSRAIVGIHPAYITKDNAQNHMVDMGSMQILAIDPLCVGIGECGYDFFHYEVDDELLELQRIIFHKQIDLALEVKKPLMLHLRSKKGDYSAYDCALESLASYGSSCPAFQTHFYAGTMDQMQKFLDLGGYISFTGVVTFTHDYDDIIQNCPLDRILCETDSPYVAPVPHRGERCTPIYVREIYEKIAKIKGVGLEVFTSQVERNMKELWGW